MKENKVNFGVTFLIAIALSIGSSLVLSFFVAIISSHYKIGIDTIMSSEIFIYISAIVPQLCFLGIFLYHKYKKNIQVSFSLNKSKFNPYILISIIALLSTITLLGSLNFTYLFNYIFSLIAKPSTVNLPINNVKTLIFSTLFLCLVPAVFEEILFRGILFPSLKKKFSLPVAIVLSALCFALMHMSLFSFIHQLFLGVILALLAYYTGSIIYGIVFHFINNFLVILIEFIFGDAVPFVIGGYSFLNVLIIIAIFVLTSAVVFLFFFMLRKKCRGQLQCDGAVNQVEENLDDENLLDINGQQQEPSKSLLQVENATEKKERNLVYASFIIAIIINLILTLIA